MSQSVITIHLVEGTVDKLHTAGINGWVGLIIVAPKLDLLDLLSHPDVQGLGVYVLIGDDPIQPDKKQIYIGQGDVVTRLKQHNTSANKSFWDDKVVVIVAKDGSLNAAHCLHIESRLIELANRSGLATVANGTNPPLPKMYAPDKTVAENFLENIQVLLPVLGIDYFTPPKAAKVPQTSLTTNINMAVGQIQADVFVLSVSKVSAEAQLVIDDFVVRQGAAISPTEGALSKSYSALRAQLWNSGLLAADPQSKQWILTQDYPFASPSAAAAVICGYNINGPQNWKVKGKQQTFAVWNQARINAVTPPAQALSPY